MFVGLGNRHNWAVKCHLMQLRWDNNLCFSFLFYIPKYKMNCFISKSDRLLQISEEFLYSVQKTYLMALPFAETLHNNSFLWSVTENIMAGTASVAWYMQSSSKQSPKSTLAVFSLTPATNRVFECNRKSILNSLHQVNLKRNIRRVKSEIVHAKVNSSENNLYLRNSF